MCESSEEHKYSGGVSYFEEMVCRCLITLFSTCDLATSLVVNIHNVEGEDAACGETYCTVVEFQSDRPDLIIKFHFKLIFIIECLDVSDTQWLRSLVKESSLFVYSKQVSFERGYVCI